MEPRRLAAMLAAAGLLAGSLVAGAAPAYASGTSYDGTDPAATGCVNGSRVIWSAPLNNYTDASENMGEMEVMYSPSCVTNWVRIYINPGQPYTLSASKWIERPNGQGGPTYQNLVTDAGPGWSYGMQVYAPGCIYVQGMILTPASMAAENGGPLYIC